MAKVQVSRQSVDVDNQIIWDLVEVDETELNPGEFPHREPVFFTFPE
jgi:hypothetical protein